MIIIIFFRERFNIFRAPKTGVSMFIFCLCNNDSFILTLYSFLGKESDNIHTNKCSLLSYHNITPKVFYNIF